MPETRYAILIGNSSYPQEKRLSQLRCPEQDVTGVCDRLTSAKNGLFDPAHVALLTNAPHYEVLQAIERTIKLAGRNDLLLIYYSGHGQCDEAGRLHLAASNTRLGKPIGEQEIDSLLDRVRNDFVSHV